FDTERLHPVADRDIRHTIVFGDIDHGSEALVDFGQLFFRWYVDFASVYEMLRLSVVSDRDVQLGQPAPGSAILHAEVFSDVRQGHALTAIHFLEFNRVWTVLALWFAVDLHSGLSQILRDSR